MIIIDREIRCSVQLTKTWFWIPTYIRNLWTRPDHKIDMDRQSWSDDPLTCLRVNSVKNLSAISLSLPCYTSIGRSPRVELTRLISDRKGSEVHKEGRGVENGGKDGRMVVVTFWWSDLLLSSMSIFIVFNILHFLRFRRDVRHPVDLQECYGCQVRS